MNIYVGGKGSRFLYEKLARILMNDLPPSVLQHTERGFVV